MVLSGCKKTKEGVEVVTAVTSGRSNGAKVLTPVAAGSVVYGNEAVRIDASNARDGYLVVKYLGDSDNVKLQLTGPDNVTYTYNLNKEENTLPLSGDSGLYTAHLYVGVSGNEYATAYADSFELELVNKLGPYLYPNIYVDFNSATQAVRLAENLSEDASCDLDVVYSVYEYVTENISYDREEAATIGNSTYFPDVDEILATKKGICFDYAALMAAMLRSQSIPTRLEIGYAGDAYHAWISTYIRDVGWIDGFIEFDGKSWTLMDPTFAASAGSKDSLKKFIGDGSSYFVKYKY